MTCAARRFAVAAALLCATCAGAVLFNADDARAQTSVSPPPEDAVAPAVQIVAPAQSFDTVVTVAPASSGFYVKAWTGSACASAPTGEDDAVGGESKTCEVPAETAVSVGVVFAPVRDCANEKREPGASVSACGDSLVRTVAVLPSAGTGAGTVAASVAGTVLAENESAEVLRSATVTFTATPRDDNYYVSAWSGSCAGSETGINDDPGAAKTCEVPAGTVAVAAGASFESVVSCAGANQVAKTAGTCACDDGYFDPDGVMADGTGLNCVEKRITTAYLNARCFSGASSFLFPPDTPVSNVRANDPDFAVAAFCFFFSDFDNPGLPDASLPACYVVEDGEVVKTGEELVSNQSVSQGVYPEKLCETLHPACDSTIGAVQVTDGNPFSGCHHTDESCQSVDGNSVAATDKTACECPNGGTFPACNAP